MICVSLHVAEGFVEGTLWRYTDGYDLFMGYRVPTAELGTTPTGADVVTFFEQIYLFLS